MNSRYWPKLAVCLVLLALAACGGGGDSSSTPATDPMAPTAITVTAGNAEVAITWGAVTGATSYNIYRSTTHGSQGTKVGASSVTSYTDTTAVNGTTYFYEVTADDAAGESPVSAQSSAATPEVPAGAPAAPTEVTVNAGNAKVTVTWTPVTGATSYNIYRSTAQGSQGTKVGASSTASYSDTGAANGTTYYYEVTADNAVGESAASGQSAGATPGAPVAAPSAPTALTVSAGNAQVTVNWTAVTGAISYNIYRSTTAGTRGTKIGSTAAASYADTTAINGTTYYYEVSAVNAAGESTASAQSSGVTPAAPVTVPAAPTGVNATAGNARVLVSWTAATGATSYNIYRSTAQGTQGAKIGSSAVNSYTDTTAANGTTYYYEVTAVDSVGEGPASTQSAGATPEVPVNVPAAPTGVNAAAGNAQVTVTWTAATGATSYNIYRSSSQGSQGTKIGSSTTTTYADAAAVNGTGYYYEVTAVNAGGEGPPSSQTAVATPSAVIQEWTFENGAMTEVTFGIDPPGVYGTIGVAAAGNVPGGRAGVMTWTDGANLWLFGGAQVTNQQIFGDLWKYNIASGLWTWVGGSQTSSSIGVYGQLGSAAAGNIPGARFGAVTWTDGAGIFWMFGGQGIDSTGTLVLLNDLWKYTPTTSLWTWVSGSNIGNQSGVYGTIGVAAGANVPGARLGAISWTDATGNLYVFGGDGLDGTATQNALNDLWMYSPSSGRWTWVSGSTTGGASGVYGTPGAAAAANAPGAREYASSWIDSTGNLWMFGGNGFAATTTGELSDLWKFTPGTGQWTWMTGSQDVNQLGVYGTLGTASAGNAPGARYQAATWVDSAGKLRMFGGYGFSSAAGYSPSAPFAINVSDFWLYDPTVNEWTWAGGASDYAEPAICGTQGVAAPSNIPGARYGTGSWRDNTGSLWLFGGTGANCEINGGFQEGVQMNDLWRYGN
jgi:fibronectin type 3 domain-containing protein